MAPDHPLILYHYSYSPFARRVVWYLTLRRIPYIECIQPPILPRPTITTLGTAYRRIPLLSIGRHIYVDTRLILQKLDALYPPSDEHPSLTPSPLYPTPLQHLFSVYTIENLFPVASALIPASTPLLNDPRFVRDREDYSGRSWKKDVRARARLGALVEIERALIWLEETVFAAREKDGEDGEKEVERKKWVLGTEECTMVDIEAIWVFHWLFYMKGALPTELKDMNRFPGVWAWVERFDKMTREKGKEMQKIGNVRKVEPVEAVRITVEAGGFEEGEEGLGVREGDPSGLKKGEVVDVWPVDTGFSHQDRGVLVKLDEAEIVIESGMGMEGGQMVRVHAPRHGFKVMRVERVKL